MKQLLLGLAVVLSLGLFGVKFAYANYDLFDLSNHDTLVKEADEEPSVYVYNVDYGSDGKIKVTVQIKNKQGYTSYRVKVTPTSQITGVIVEGSLYCDTNATSGQGSVTFNCKSGKEGDAQMCVAYTFNAEIVGR